MAADLVVGVDLGTTALKGVLATGDGRVLAGVERSYGIERPRPEWAEQDPGDWLGALREVLAVLEPAAAGRRAAAIGICGQTNTHVFADAAGEALRPAIVWQDQRCAPDAAELERRLAAAAPATAARVGVAASSLPARAAWVAREEPEVWAATRAILAPKDFVVNRLCGPAVPATDPITPFDLVAEHGGYDDDLVGLVEGVRDRLPEVRPVDSVVGTVGGDSFPLLAGAAVVTGTMDAWGCLYGSGAVDHGEAMEVAGTSEILGVLSRERRPSPGVVSFLPVDGLHLHAGPTQAGGAALAWFASLGRLGLEEAVELAAAAPPGSRGLIFLPHLLGERAPLWDGDVRGAFVGLGSDHNLADLCRAVLEGVAYSARHLLEALEQAAAVVPDELRASGGGSRSDLWCQIKADVLERPVARLRVRHSGCLGAALMAASGVDLVESVREGARRNVHVERTFEPQGGRGVYDELYGLYRGLYEALKPTHAALAELRRRPQAPTVLGGLQ